MNDDELRDALHGGVPAAPEVSRWADKARRRSRRTRALATGASLLAVAVVGALVIGNLRPGGTAAIPAAPQSSPPVTISAPATTPTADGCDPGATLPAAPEHLPSGATAVRLCPDGYDPDATFITPTDLLTEGVSELIDTINATPLVPLSDSCRKGYPRTFRVVFGYPDGSQITLIGRLASSDSIGGGRDGSCDLLGRTDAWHSGQLLHTLRSAWLHQRGDSRNGQPYPDPDCSMTSPSVFAADLAEVTTAIVCGRGGSNLGRAGVLTTEQARAVTADIAQRSSPGADDTQNFATIINLFTPWGDLITLYKADGSTRWGFLNSQRSGLKWTPSAGIRAWLDPIIGGAPPTSSPSGKR